MPTEPKVKYGLLELIKDASTVEQLDELVARGATFKYAHQSTKNRWAKAAKIKRATFGAKPA